jgi:hypothetical protein
MVPVIGYQFLKPLFWPLSVDKVSGTIYLDVIIHDPLCICLCR